MKIRYLEKKEACCMECYCPVCGEVFRGMKVFLVHVEEICKDAMQQWFNGTIVVKGKVKGTRSD